MTYRVPRGESRRTFCPMCGVDYQNLRAHADVEAVELAQDIYDAYLTQEAAT